MKLQRYADHQPTEFDRKGAFLPDRQDWLIAPCSQTRDSGTLERSNFTELLYILGGEGDDVEVHRFGHWGPGWYELVLVRPNSVASRVAAILADKLDIYPVLNEDEWSNLEYEEAQKFWASCSLKERIYWCKRYDVSIFAARRGYVPDDPRGELISALAE